jgi:hypothetical protein
MEWKVIGANRAQVSPNWGKGQTGRNNFFGQFNIFLGSIPHNWWEA